MPDSIFSLAPSPRGGGPVPSQAPFQNGGDPDLAPPGTTRVPPRGFPPAPPASAASPPAWVPWTVGPGLSPLETARDKEGLLRSFRNDPNFDIFTADQKRAFAELLAGQGAADPRTLAHVTASDFKQLTQA